MKFQQMGVESCPLNYHAEFLFILNKSLQVNKTKILKWDRLLKVESMSRAQVLGLKCLDYTFNEYDPILRPCCIIKYWYNIVWYWWICCIHFLNSGEHVSASVYTKEMSGILDSRIPPFRRSACQVFFLSICLLVRLSCYQVIFLSGGLAVMLSFYPVVSFLAVLLPVWSSSSLPVSLSFCQVFFLSGRHPVMPSSCQFVFLSVCLPVLLSSCQVVFILGRLPVMVGGWKLRFKLPQSNFSWCWEWVWQ